MTLGWASDHIGLAGPVSAQLSEKKRKRYVRPSVSPA